MRRLKIKLKEVEVANRKTDVAVSQRREKNKRFCRVLYRPSSEC